MSITGAQWIDPVLPAAISKGDRVLVKKTALTGAGHPSPFRSQSGTVVAVWSRDLAVVDFNVDSGTHHGAFGLGELEVANEVARG